LYIVIVLGWQLALMTAGREKNDNHSRGENIMTRLFYGFRFLLVR